MKTFLALIVISSLGALTLGCDSNKSTTQDKIQTTTTQTRDGKVVGEKTITNETKTKATTPTGGGAVTEKTTETTTETTK